MRLLSAPADGTDATCGMINEAKYHNLFVSKIKADASRLTSGLDRFISEQGRTDETIIQFYRNEFDWAIGKAGNRL